ncbi:MAG: hypothetical protein AB7V46_02015 [Thermomicrobiales bacterium]
MTLPRLGLSYFGNRYHAHAFDDLRAIAATGASIVDHVMSEEDLRWNPGTIADLVAVSKELDLETWLAPWGLGGVFGGEAASYAVMESPDQCQRDQLGNHLPALCFNQPAFHNLFLDWLDVASAAGVDVVTWDEPHLALPFPSAQSTRWACRCDTCQRRFAEQFGKNMPREWDGDVATFHQQTIERALDFLISSAAQRGLDSAIIFLPDENAGDHGWQDLATRSDVRYLGLSPYWILQGISTDEFEPWLRRWCQKTVAATAGRHAASLAWIQAFSVPAGREQELRTGMEIMRAEGIETICVWSYRACEAMSGLTPDDPERVWSTVREGFDAVGSQG